MTHDTGGLNNLDKHGVVIFDEHGAILAANKQFCALTQYAKEDLLGRPDPSLGLPSDEHTAVVPDFWAKVTSGLPEIGQFKRFDAQGRTIWVTGRYTKREAQDGCPSGVTLIARDVTQDVLGPS